MTALAAPPQLLESKMLVSFLPFDNTARTNMLLKLTNSTTNLANSNVKPLAKDTTFRPVTTADYMTFNGASTVRFDNTQYPNGTGQPSAPNYWHVTVPYSVELEFYADAIQNGWVATGGEGSAQSWPEWSIVATSNGEIQFQSSSTNNSNDTLARFTTSYAAKQWYRVGFMFYNDAQGNVRVRGYLNGTQVFDIASRIPITSTLGLAVGSDFAFQDSSSSKARIFKGRIRNVQVARSLFWTV